MELKIEGAKKILKKIPDSAKYLGLLGVLVTSTVATVACRKEIVKVLSDSLKETGEEEGASAPSLGCLNPGGDIVGNKSGSKQRRNISVCHALGWIPRRSGKGFAPWIGSRSRPDAGLRHP